VELESKILLIGEYPPPFAGIGVQTELLYKLYLKNNIKVNLLSVTPKKTGLFSHFNEVKFFRGILNLLRYLFNLHNIRKADIIHILASSGLNFYIFTFTALLVSKLVNKKIIIHYHGGGAYDFFKNKKSLLKLTKKLSDVLVVPSGFLQDVFNDFEFESIIIPNAINLIKFKFKEVGTVSPTVLSARNFTSTYNISCAIRAFKILHSEFSEARMTIAGKGPEKNKLVKLTQQLKLEKFIQFVGNIPNQEMASLYNKSDILINTSNVDNLPVSLLEAQATGLVIVSTNPGGIPYIITNKINGLLADINDPETLGCHLINVIKNQNLSKNMIQQGLVDVQKMDSTKVLRQWVDLYKNLT